jgi:oleandomycin transport system ATP-binding protein
MYAAIEAAGLHKAYDGRPAVSGVDLEVPTGTVLGLLGPNGAGKTTTVRMLATLVRPDAGRATVGGFDVVTQAHQVRGVIGLTGQFAAVDLGISGWENLYLVARLHGLPRRRARVRAGELLEQFDLVEHGSKAVGRCSGGQRRRLDLAASMVARPEVLFLDEPTTGLDPRTRNVLWDAVRTMVRDGTTVLLTTQHMEEAEALADHVVVMDGGVVIESGSSAQLRAKVGEEVLRIVPADPADAPAIADALRRAGLRGAGTDVDGAVSVAASDPTELTTALRVVAGAGIPVADLATRAPSLDEAFLTLTGRDRRTA